MKRTSTMSQPPPTITQDSLTIWRNESQLTVPSIKIVLNSVCLMFCLFGLVGNAVVFFLLGFRIKRNKFTVYIVNLAFADFLYLLCITCLIFLFIVCFVGPLIFEQYKETIKKVLLWTVAASLFGYNTSHYVLTAISVERCLSVFYPIWYKCHRPKHLSAVTCSLLWILSFLVTIAENFICEKKIPLSVDEELLTKNSEQCKVVYAVIDLLTFLIFTPVMVIASVTLLIKVKRDSWKQQTAKLYMVIVVTVVFFLTFAIPMRVMLQVQYRQLSLLPILLFDVSSLLGSINSSVNPFIYWFIGRRGDGKCSFKLLLQRIFREDTGEPTQEYQPETTGTKETEMVL